MNRKTLVACAVSLVALAVLLIGAEPAGSGPARWEYGRYTESPGNFEWDTATTHIRATNPTFFFERMGFPTDIEVSSRTGRVQPLLLNHLGRQGWELVEVVVDASRRVYWFKRPG